MLKIILASQSKVRKKILDEHNILNEVRPSNVDEDIIKISLLKEKASHFYKESCYVAALNFGHSHHRGFDSFTINYNSQLTNAWLIVL